MTSCLARTSFVTLASLVALTGVSGPAAGAEPVHANQANDQAGTNYPTTHIDVRAVRLQQRAQTTRAAYDLALEQVAASQAHLMQLQTQADRSSATAESLYNKVSGHSNGGVFGSIARWITGSESDVDKAADAVAAAQHMQDLVDLSKQGINQAQADADLARRTAEEAKSAASDMSSAVSARAAAVIAIRQSKFRPTYAAADADQDRRNRKAAAHWKSYLKSLAGAHVVPPAAESLRDPDRLRARMRPVVDPRGWLIPGIAQVKAKNGPSVTVLPAATVRAVSQAFSDMGLPDASHTNLAEAFDCGGLTQQAWSTARVKVPTDDLTQWQQLANVPKRQLATGDTVFFRDGARDRGSYSSGMYVGRHQAITYDALTSEIAVRPVKEKRIIGVRRATLPAPATSPAIPAVLGAGCRPVSNATAELSGGSVLSFPMAASSYTMSAGFGQGGSLWSSGAHTGQDFAASIGTPVFAALGGVVTVQETPWAGDLVRIDHGAGIETWYAHMSRVDVQTGDQVETGQGIGAVGDRGNTTGPHLHFEVHVDDRSIDPMPLLDPAAAGSTAYGFGNGEIPESTLCTVSATSSLLLRCDAAVGYRLMDAAYAAEFGVPLCITDGYRTLSAQHELATTKPTLAAAPGSSNHGWGVAVDLCGGVESFSSSEHQWLAGNAPRFGWQHPEWAKTAGNRAEPWHFEFGSGV